MNNGPETVSSAAVPFVPEHQLLRPIASGAYGQVWLARNALGVYRAVKIVHRASFDHDRPFEREFAGIKAFEPVSRSHEGLVDLLQVGRDNASGYFYYVMELADDARAPRSDGKAQATRPCDTPSQQSITPPLQQPDAYSPRTLDAELKQRGRLPLEECIQIGLALTQALAYLHSQGLVHRDIKPSNIIFVRGVPKLADVGLVTGVGQALSFVGTEGFIAPEGPGTPQADIYSLGIVLYVLSTGNSHQDFPEPPADLGAQENRAQWLEFDEVVHKACQANVRERFQSAEAMHAELRLLEGGQSVRRKRAVQQRWVVARKLALGLIAVVLGCLALPSLKGAKHAYTPKPEAARLYERGQWQYYQLTPIDHVKAFSNLTLAVQIDPKFPQPYGELTALYGWDLLPELATEKQRLQGMREIARKASSIDPNLPEAHTASSFCHFLQRGWRGAEQEIQRAIEVNPDYAIAHFIYCFYLSLQGRTAEAEREGQRAWALDPYYAKRVSAIAAAFPFMAERRFDRAITQLHQVLEIERNFAMGHDYLGDCYEAQSNYLYAIEEHRSAELLSGLDPGRVAEIYGALRKAFETQGEQGYLRKMIEVTLADEALPVDKQMFPDTSNCNLAGYYARLGEKGKALDDLEKHFDEPNVWSQIKFLPLYDSLHDEPRYKALVRRAKLAP
jgi:tetratricopeptide (TPR) repeat protein